MISKLLHSAHKYIINMYLGVIMSGFVMIPIRPYLMRLAGVKIGRRAHISRGAIINPAAKNIGIGDLFVCGMDVFLDGTSRLEIGNRVHIGLRSSIITATHNIMPSIYRRDRSDLLCRPVTIEDGVWIGAHSIILPGVHIQKGCVIGAGSTVTQSCLSNGLYVGSPARRIKDLPVHTAAPFEGGVEVLA
jgi:maltose O-acetyltransferase